MKQPIMNLKYVMLIIILFLIGSGCKDDPQSPPDDPPVDPIEDEFNPNTPNANDLIITEGLLGDADKQSSIWEIIDSGDGGFYFRGYYNDKYAIGKLDQTGQDVWIFRSRYSVRDHIRISGLSGELSNSVLSVGGFDSNFDGDFDIGYVSLFNRAGSLIDELSFSNDDAAVWLSALGVSGTSDTLCQFVAAGCAEMSGIYYPYIARFTVANDSTMIKTGEKIFTDLPAKNFRNIQFDLEQTPPTCYLQGDEYSTGAGYGDQVVYQLSDEMEISWSQGIVAQAGFASWTSNGRGFACASNMLLMASTTEIDKETNPTNGGHWRAGVIARLSTDGSVDWVKSIVLSQYSDNFYSCCFSDGVLSVGGKCSSFMNTKSRNVFGNALLLEVDPDTGDVITNLSFGSKYYRSRFNHVIVRGSQAFAVGLTNNEVDDGPYQGWFVIIDVSGASIVSDLSIPEFDYTRDRDAGNNSDNLEETGFRGGS